MSGCYGSSAEDRYRDNELGAYLASQDNSDIENQVVARQEEIYGDLEAFNQYMVYENEGFFAIALQLNRAIGLAGKTDAISIQALQDAMVEIKAALDAHIDNTVRVME